MQGMNEFYSVREIIRMIEPAGEARAKLDIRALGALSFLGGVFVSLGAIFSTIVTTGISIGFGLTQVLCGVAFSLGLVLVAVTGTDLFMSDNSTIMAFFSRKIGMLQLIRYLAAVYFFNLLGALCTVLVMVVSDCFLLGNNSAGETALAIAGAKVNMGFHVAFVRGILGSILISLAVWLSYNAKTLTGCIMAIVFPASAFIACGFEYSIANMYLIPAGIVCNQLGLAHTGNPLMYSQLNIFGFLNNIIPVTLGNICGAGLLVGAFYYTALSKVGSDPYNHGL